MNGLNEPNLNMYERLLSSHQLVAFQETKFNKYDSLQSNEHFIYSAYSGTRCFWSHTTSPVFDERRGVALLLSSSSPFGEVEDLTANVYTEQIRNRYLLLKTCLGDQAVLIHVVYAPDEPSRREEFFHSLPVNFDHTRSDRTSQDEDSFHIVLGDFNVTLDSYLDQATPSHHLPAQGRPALRNWLDALGLIDAWRFKHPDVREFTSPTRKNRLDYCFLTVPLIRDHLATINHVRDREWRCEDHTPVEFTLHAKNLPRLKKAPWRCSTWLLQVPDVREYLVCSAHALADRIKIFPGTNPGCLLDGHKRSDSIYLRRKWIELRDVDSRCMSAKVTAVNEALDLCNACPTQENLTKCEQARAELAAYRDTIKQRNEAKSLRPTSTSVDVLLVTSSGHRNRTVSVLPSQSSRGRMELSQKIFKKSQMAIDAIGEMSPTSPDLRQPRHDSYNPLHLRLLLRDSKRRLTRAQQAMLDSPITANDLYWAIVKSKNGKAPGPDGLPIEYYKLAPDLWARIYEVVHDYQLARGKMTKFQRRAHLSLLYKAGDRYLPGNYRPLTLLNHDAKLGPKVMAWRLGSVLPFIIHEDQKGFVPGRSIRHLLLQFQDLQDICRLRYPDACAVLMDFAKAFDSVLWPALDVVLQHFGFGSTFRAWVKTFYKDTSVIILLNNSPGKPFLLGAGVRQGDPLSPGLFVVFIEPMMNFLRARLSAKGLAVNQSSMPHLVMAFADDCTGILTDVNDAQGFLELVQEYAKAAGLVLNMRKTSIMPFTHHVSQDKLSRLRSSTPLHVLDIGDSTKLLGVLQGATTTATERLNTAIAKMRVRCSIWKYRARTLRGKVVLLQSIILPLFWYTACVTAVSPPILKVLDAIIRNFVHGHDITGPTAASGKFDKGWIYTPVRDGGLGLTPPKKFIQAMHLKCLRDRMVSTNTMCRAPRWILPALELFSTALGSLGEGFDILYANMRGKRWSGLPSFWRTTLRLWAELNDTYGTTNWKPFVQVMPFWYNLHFTFGKANSPLSDVSKPTNSALKSLVFSRLQDYVDRYGTYVTKEILLSLLDVSTFARPSSRTRLVTDTMTRFNLLLPQDGPRYGPMRSPLIESACHDWSLNGMLVINMKNRDFVHLLSTKIPDQEACFTASAATRCALFSPFGGHVEKRTHVGPICSSSIFGREISAPT